MNLRSLLILPAAAIMFTSCNNPVLDDEGDCAVHYYLRFVYNMNLKWADAFPSEVTSVNLYAFDENGIFVKEFTGRGSALSEPGYSMELTLDPGNYQLVAWCGLYNDGEEMTSFTVPAPTPGVTTLEELTCSLNTQTNEEYGEYSDKRLYFMYHGDLKVDLPDSQDGEDYYYTMPLIKDTNHIRIILQQLSGEDMDPSQFAFNIESADGVLAWDNTIASDVKVSYLQWNRDEAEAGVSKKNPEGIYQMEYVKGVVADLSVSRMMVTEANDFALTVTNLDKGENIITRVPIIQYALLSKDYYELAYNHSMTDQEFLDREDEYILTFFLDENMKWIDNTIYIHSWRVVQNNQSFN
ncbi:MAG: FimB/Mfa2 family fimbrial subunit [Muribaculaceae bacterium]|nr:FimB/Mfa2 family fimbrial subunit [Muribaculaceae bacterium]